MNIISNGLLWFAYFISLYFAVFWLLVFLTQTEQHPRKKVKTFPLVSIIVPAYNEENSIIRTLKHLIQIDYPKEKLEILVINDGSKDKTQSLVKSFIKQNKSFNIQLIYQENQGKGAALNNGLRRVKGSYFVCLDADSFVQKNALKKMLPYFTDENVASVLPALTVEKPEKTLQKLQWYEYIINLFYKELMGKLNCVHVTPGPFSVYSTAILKKLGGFDENNITEDLEMALRLQKNQYKIIQILDTKVTTLSPSTIKTLYAQRNRWFKGATLNAIKYRGMIGNKKYGDFGLIQMPTIILSGVISLILLGSIIYYTLKPALLYLYHISLIDFDIWTLINALAFDVSIWDLNYITIFVGLTMLSITVLVMNKSQVMVEEKLMKYGSLPIIAYLFLYFFFLAGVWVGVLFDLMRGRTQQW